MVINIKNETITNEKKYNLTNDYLFKRTFGYVGQEHITKVFLRDIFKRNITNVKLDNNTITEKDMIDDKMGIMDIKAVFNEFEQVDIEMQVVEQADIARRILFYLSKMYAKQIKAGTDYALAKRTIAILITDYAIKEIKEVPKYATKWNFREEDYPKIVLTDAMEICIIELAKLSKYAKKTNNKNLELWLEFIKNPGVKIVMNKNDNESLKETKEAIQAAKEHYEELKKDKHEMELAELREKYIMDQKSISKAGYDRGYDAGYDKGETSGYDKAKIETAKELLKQGVESKIIAKATGLTEKDLEKLL